MNRSSLSHVAASCCFLTLSASTASAAYRVVHVAGLAESGFSGDDGPAVAARLNHPAALAFTPGGTLYIADTSNQRVRKITTNGTITTVAGNGTRGTGGDGGPAIDAELDDPIDVAADAAENVYVVTASGLRRVDAGSGRISTLFGFASWRYAVANDTLGNVYIAVQPFTSPASHGPQTQPLLITLPVPGGAPSLVPITVHSLDWSGATIYGLTASTPRHVALAFDTDHLDYGIAQAGGRIVAFSNAEIYALDRPPDLGLSNSRTLYLLGGSFYTGSRRYVIRHGTFGLTSIAGGGSDSVREGVLADTVALDPQAIAVGSDDLLYIVQAPSQVYALRREAERPGRIAGTTTGTGNASSVTVLAAGNDGSVRYAQPDRKGRFRFRDLPSASYTVYAHFDEEGLSCDAANCGWSGAPDDCPRALNDPVVNVSADQPLHRVRLRLLHSFPCV